MSAPIESIQNVNCPFCGRPAHFTDSYEDFEKHHAAYPTSPVLYRPGFPVGGWRPSVDVMVKGRRGQISRKDLEEFRVYPVLCPECRRMFVAHLSVMNVDAVRHYEEFVRPTMPPKNEWDEVKPKWGMIGFTPQAFLDEVKKIRNPMMRDGVVRRIVAAGWEYIHVAGHDVGIQQYVGAVAAETPAPVG